MTQPVVSDRFPYLAIHVTIGTSQHPDQKIDLEVLVDTGFDGGVCIPSIEIDPSIRPDGHLPWFLADGTEVRTPAYVAMVQIGSLPPVRTAVITLGDERLMGRGVTDHFRVTFDHGTTIRVEP